MNWCIHNIAVYETAQRVYLVGEEEPNENGARHRVLKFERSTGAEPVVSEDEHAYTQAELQSLLRQLHEGNRRHGGLRKVLAAPCAGVVGCFRWTSCHYLLLATRKRLVGTLCGGLEIYGVESTLLVPLAPRFGAGGRGLLSGAPAASAEEQRYRRLLELTNLTEGFFFSYDWPLWCTVQCALGAPGGGSGGAFDSDRVWNSALSRPLRAALGHDRWTVPLIHGYFRQRELSLLGRRLTLTLIARRSCQYAGTRYHKRGVNDQGCVANDCEVEQIVEAAAERRDGWPAMAAVVQVRGSVPLYWSQSWEGGDQASRLRPSIRMLHHLDPLYTATKKHFEELRARLGDDIVCLDLVKQGKHGGQEAVLGREYAAAVNFLNRRAPPCQPRLQYIAFDLRRQARALRGGLLAELQRVQTPVLAATGIYSSVPGAGSIGGRVSLQHGALRTNCVDCLDRTNVAQFSFGLVALGAQLHALGISPSPRLDSESSLADQLMALYEDMGNALAQQYGGSEAHASFFQRRRGDWQAIMQSRNLVTTLRRFYSSAVTDEDKQAAIDLFLGGFVAPGPEHRARAAEAPSMVQSLGVVQQQSEPPPDAASLPADEPLVSERATTARRSFDSASSDEAQTPSLPEILSAAAAVQEDVVPSEEPAAEEIPAEPSPPRAPVDRLGGTSPAAQEAPAPMGQYARRRQRLRGRPRLESLAEAMPPGGILQVRLTPKPKPAPPAASWLSPTKSKPASAAGETPLPPPPLPPPPRLVRSRSEGGASIQLLESGSEPWALPALGGGNMRSSRDLGGTLVLLGDGGVGSSSASSAFSSPVMPQSTGRYHTLAGLNLEGVDLPPRQPAAAQDSAAEALGSRRVSFATLSDALRGLVSPRPGAARPATAPPVAATASAPALAARVRRSQAAALALDPPGTLRPLDMTTVLYQQQAVRAGVNDLGLPPFVAPLWLGRQNPVEAMAALGSRLREEHARQMQALATPLTRAEYEALERAASEVLRPTVTVQGLQGGAAGVAC